MVVTLRVSTNPAQRASGLLPGAGVPCCLGLRGSHSPPMVGRGREGRRRTSLHPVVSVGSLYAQPPL